MTADHMSDPIAILLAEHRIAEARFAAFEAAIAGVIDTDAATVRRAVAEARATLAFLDADLEVHIREEEEPLFPRLKAALPADDRLIDEMVAEHDQARLKRDDLRAALGRILGAHDHDEVRGQRETLRAAVRAASAAPPTAGELAALRHAWRAVHATLRVHFQNEEEIVFPLAPKLLSVGELVAAGREMVAIRQHDQEQTTMTADRAGHVLVPDLRGTIADLLASPELAREGRTARTLVKEGPLRAVLLALRAGGRLAEHQAPGAVSLHGLRGRVTVTVTGADERVPLDEGGLLVLPPGLKHGVAADEDSAVLITIVGPP